MEQLTLFVEDIHASPSALQEKEKVKKTQGICGLTCSESLNELDQSGLLLKTLRDILTTDLIEFFPIWKALTTAQGYYVYQLSLSEQTITEKEYGLWPTPQAMDAMKARSPEAMNRQMSTTRKGRKKISTMKDAAVYGLYWKGEAIRHGSGELNPQTLEWMMGYPIDWTDLEH